MWNAINKFKEHESQHISIIKVILQVIPAGTTADVALGKASLSHWPQNHLSKIGLNRIY